MVKAPFLPYGCRIVLASKSPRRHALLRNMGFEVITVSNGDADEHYPGELQAGDIPLYLARKKAEGFSGNLEENDLLLTADTIVWLDNAVIGKPSGRDEALAMLRRLSGRTHEVFTGVCLIYRGQEHAFVASSKVSFSALSEAEILYYVDQYKPFDKAGAYGIQEWIGYVGVEGIDGSFYNVMGLPVQRLYTEMTRFLKSVGKL
ncbi:MAG: Maf family nucleotide pyrophosphatase [Bacteroidales bacterium]